MGTLTPVVRTSRGPFCTPLRYPGGKGRLTPFVKDVFDANGLCDGQYAEPYAGGAGIAITLLLQEYASRIHLNDLNPGVHAFWQAVVSHTDELCQLISAVPVSIEQWHQQRAIQQHPAEHSTVQLGFSTFFLNRTNRSGIINGGVIGGKSQTGTWKIDARFNRSELIQRITRIARLGSRIRLYNLNATTFIKDILPELPLSTLVYLDPPYYVKGEGLYDHFYTHSDHAEIAELVKCHIRQPWIVSYDNVPEIHSLYSGYRQIVYGLNYSAQNRYRGSEVIFVSPQLQIPFMGEA